MSFYATMHGEISYKKEEDFLNAVKLLKDGGWINEDGNFVDECKEVVSEGEHPDINREAKVISIPLFCHRNLSHILDELFKGGKGEVIWASNDGCFSGGILRDGKEQTYDLDEWAAKEGFEAVPQDTEDFDALADYQDNVIEEFVTSF